MANRNQTSRLTFFNEKDGYEFSCHLQCSRCAFIKANGERCKLRTCIGNPLCWIHNLGQYGVKVKDSTIQDGGKGLFAAKNFADGDWICPHGGENIGADCMNRRYGEQNTAPYAIDDEIDAACERGIGSMTNGKFTRNGRSRPIQEHNAELSIRRGGEYWLQATQDIAPGEEIFVYYGNAYELYDAEHDTRRTTTPANPICPP